MDSHSMASKVNREVCQLKVNGCLLHTLVCFYFSVRDKRREGKKQQRRRRRFTVVCSLGGSRGQDLIRLRSYQSQCLTRAGWNQSCLFSVLGETVLHLSSVSLSNGGGWFCLTSDSSRWTDFPGEPHAFPDATFR